MGKGIKKREGEVWKKETYYFYCPVCEKPYNIKYDASTRTTFDGEYEEDTCFVKQAKCACCKTKLYVAYDVEHQGVLAYDIKEERRWQDCAFEFDKVMTKLIKVKKQLKKKETAELKKKKKSLKKECERLEKEIIDQDNQYEEVCLAQVTAREIEESKGF